MSDTEQTAIDLGNDPVRLRKRLLDAKRVLHSELSARFRRNKFDAANKRLVSDDGTFCLQWQLRTWPAAPESYTNQQTNIGTVVIRPS